VTVALIDAIERLDERKMALIETHGSVAVPDKLGLLLASGLDLDPEEFLTASRTVADLTCYVAERAGLNLNEVVAGTWRDGVTTGLLLAEMRGSNVDR
jgi:hypothetical protein